MWTVDEKWILHYTPETKQRSKQWTSSGEPTLKKAKSVPSAGKVMTTIFWDSKGIIHIDYLEKGKIITGKYYGDLLGRFDKELERKNALIWPRKKCRSITTAHRPIHPQLPTAKLIELRYELLSHPLYSPDLAPCDFLFLNPKIWLGGKKFASNEVIAATNVYFAEFQPSYFLDGLKKWEHRWTKCISK
ncbi:PREDICTED: histone-lysine N-methyltransferase SETMAR-like [Cyphomyrmex costatus]|uniref:histone-lysine N-methyltransferase SETMAR-like n=1 Tax=Cyphomyrmex costatus TaxID=456900 RepID=UPI0008523BD2|nr:PREDICTED: histone-lysine N-methyltransferase SETMAR-like [Cyphomyrmex costatus]